MLWQNEHELKRIVNDRFHEVQDRASALSVSTLYEFSSMTTVFASC